MALDFELDISKFLRGIEAAEDAVKKGAKQGLDDVKDDWTREARDIAPLDSSNLRRQIDGEVDGFVVTMTGNAVENSKRYGRFNYGYWLHEKAPSSTNLTTPGTKLKFFDESGNDRKDDWLKMIENEIKEELRKAGW